MLLNKFLPNNTLFMQDAHKQYFRLRVAFYNSNKCFWMVISLFMLGTVHVHAAFLKNVPQTVTQPNGQSYNLLATGDEYFHRLHDIDGFTVVQNPETGWFCFATVGANGALQATEFKFGINNSEQTGLVPNIMPSKKWLEKNLKLHPYNIGFKTKNFGGLPSNTTLPDGLQPNAPSTGTINNIVVFIRFSDEPEFTTTSLKYDTMLNRTNGNSMRTYYRNNSYGRLEVNSVYYPSCTPTQTISFLDIHPRNYYRKNSATNPLGYLESQRSDRERDLLARAIAAIAPSVPANMNIDADNDGTVDNIVFIVSGRAEGWSDLLWPHRWTLASGSTINGKDALDFNLLLDNGLETGVLCHEFGHTLGAPDFYHYTDQNSLNPTGEWELMSSGYATPAQPSGSYIKSTYYNWLAPPTLITQSGRYTLRDISKTSGNSFRINSINSANEYFILDYRDTRVYSNSGLSSSGMLVYRVDSTQYKQGNGNSGPTLAPDELYIMRPNGSINNDGYLAGATFSASLNRSAFNSNTLPAPTLRNGLPAGFQINNISNSDTTISFNVVLESEATSAILDIKPSFGVAGNTVSVSGIGLLNIETIQYQGQRMARSGTSSMTSFKSKIPNNAISPAPICISNFGTETCSPFNFQLTTDSVCLSGDTVYTNFMHVFDAGGTGDYVNGENIKQVFHPKIRGQKLTFKLESVDIEQGYDTLYVFDGASTSSRLLGAITGNAVVQQYYTATNAAGAITLLFKSDQGVTGRGFQGLVLVRSNNEILVARNASNGSLVTIKGVVTRARGSVAFVQDYSAGIAVRESAGTFANGLATGAISQGDSILISGYISTINSLRTITPTSFRNLARNQDLPAYQNVSVAELSNNPSSYESELIRVPSLTLQANPIGQYASNGIYVLSEYGSNSPLSFYLLTKNNRECELIGRQIETTALAFNFSGIFAKDSIIQNGNAYYCLLPILNSDWKAEYKPNISNFTPVYGKAGDTITVFGGGFSNIISFHFGLGNGTVINKTDSSARVIVPSNATSGPMWGKSVFGTPYSNFSFQACDKEPIPSIINTADYTACSGTYTMTARAGFSAYKWNDGVRSQTNTVLTSGSYAVAGKKPQHGIASVGIRLPQTANGFGFRGTTPTDEGLTIQVKDNLVLDSVTVYPETAGILVLNVEDTLGRVLQNREYVVSIGNVPIRLAVGFSLPVGKFRLTARNSNMNLGRHNSVGALNFPYTVDSVLAITNGFITGTENDNLYYYYYDMKVSQAQRCFGPYSEPVRVNLVRNSPPVIARSATSANRIELTSQYPAYWLYQNSNWNIEALNATPLASWPANNPGIYYAYIVTRGCTSDTSAAFLFTDVPEMQKNSTANFKVYPNPAMDVLNVEMPSIGLLEVSTIQGKSIFSQVIEGNASLNTATWPTGMYIIRVKGSKAQTLVIQH